MKCEYCGFEFDSPLCPNCGAFAPEHQIHTITFGNPDKSDINNRTGTNHYSGIKIRSIVSCVILVLITCGLYLFIWMSSLTDESNYLSKEPNPTSGSTAVLLTILTCGIYSFYWAYKQGEKIDRARTLQNMEPKKRGTVFILLMLIPYFGPISSFCIMQNEINRLAA